MAEDIEIWKKVKLMGNIRFFEKFSAHELLEAARMSDLLRFKASDSIIKEGDFGCSFWVLLKGSVSVIKKIDGQTEPRTLATIPAGECFGEMAMISGQPRTADIIATEEAFLFKIEGYQLDRAPEFLQLKFYKRFSELLVARLSTANVKQAPTKPSNPAKLEKPRFCIKSGRNRLGKEMKASAYPHDGVYAPKKP